MNVFGVIVMSDQVQELLKRVYDEGVTKAKVEADRIIEEAQQEAETIKVQAASDAKMIVEKAQQEAKALSKNTDSDLKMAAQQTLSVIKQKVTDLILDQAFDTKTDTLFKDSDFIKQLVLETLKVWNNSLSEGSLVLSESYKAQIDKVFTDSLKDVFSGKLEISFSPIMKKGFVLQPQDGTYKLSFTDEDFSNLFKNYLRPRTAQLLFND
jgi:V/A-type H+-transporting ATPase subunit E